MDDCHAALRRLAASADAVADVAGASVLSRPVAQVLAAAAHQFDPARFRFRLKWDLGLVSIARVR